MARQRRLEIENGWYHVINRGHQKRKIYRDKKCYENFLERLKELPERFGLRVHTYVLMPNHYHLILQGGKAGSLSRGMHWLNTGYGIWHNRRYQRPGALFGGRYKAILFEPGECLMAIHYYIHLNPIRVGVLKRVDTKDRGEVDEEIIKARRKILNEYEWSSYREYAGLAPKSGWLTTEVVREWIGPSERAYREEVNRRATKGELGLAWKGEIVAGMMMGGEKWVKEWKALLRRGGEENGRETKRFGVVNWEEIVMAIEEQRGQSWEELVKSRGNDAEAIAIWFARRRGGMRLEEIGERLGKKSYHAVAIKNSRFERRLIQEKTLRMEIDKIAQRLNVQC
jgi:putative transposase